MLFKIIGVGFLALFLSAGVLLIIGATGYCFLGFCAPVGQAVNRITKIDVGNEERNWVIILISIAVGFCFYFILACVCFIIGFPIYLLAK